ncbi:MAG: hypothetical protein CW338_02095 [Clostridiales bacterium]|nr:hypothetical protein [Clostridiales bacterium]
MNKRSVFAILAVLALAVALLCITAAAMAEYYPELPCGHEPDTDHLPKSDPEQQTEEYCLWYCRNDHCIMNSYKNGHSASVKHNWDATGKCKYDGCGYQCQHKRGWKDDDTCEICGALNPDIAAFNAYKAELAQKWRA